MKDLKTLLEEITKETRPLIDYIINNLEFASKEKLEKIKSLLSNNDIDETKLMSFLQSKGIGDLSDQILSAFDKFNQINKLIDIINNSTDKSSKDLLKYNNIYKVFDNIIDNNTLLYLSNIITPKGTVARGRFEVVLNLFLNDITIGNVGKGDVNTTELGFIELKAPKARIKGSLKPSPGNCTIVFKELISNKNIDITHFNIVVEGIFKNSTYTKNICLKLLNEYNLSKDEIIEILAKSMLAKYIFQNTTHVEDELISILKENEDEIFGKRKNAKIIFDLFLVLDMYFYQMSEGWNYIMIFKGKDKDNINGEYVLLNSNDIKQGLKKTQKTLIKYNITTPTTTCVDKDSYGSACQIVIK